MPTDLYRELCRPDAYPGHPAEVEHLQTHISHIFFVGDVVYKVKKPVDLGFLDYTSLAAREHFCHEEVRLNRRLAPDVYRGVVAIRRREDGNVRVGNETENGDIIDWAVEMRRLPASRMLDQLLDSGSLDNQKIRDLARLLARFHESAATGPEIDAFGSLATVRANCEENFEQTTGFTTGPEWTISPMLHRFLRDRVNAFLDRNESLLQSRVANGRIRDGHGDLHAGNICLLKSDIVVYDCIEFAARFRCGDVAADLAFLLMDLDLRGFRAFARFLAREYVEQSKDRDLSALTDFYKGYRAVVRGKVTSIPLENLVGDALRAERERAMDYFHLAASYELPPALIVCCGLPGCGKSFAAAHIARPFEAVVLNSDATRKRMAGVPPTKHTETGIDEGIYDRTASAHTYSELLRRAADHLKKERTVVVDAGFRAADQRRPFVELASETNTPCIVLHVDTTEQVIFERLRFRSAETHVVSDAGVDVYRALAGRFEAPMEIADSQRLRYDGISSTAELTSALLDKLIQLS